MRTVTDAERAQVGAAELQPLGRLEITDSDGNWRDVSTGLSTPDWFNSATITENIDSNTTNLAGVLLRDTGTLSLCPLRTDSLVNRNDADAYAPMLDVGRKWRSFSGAIAKGANPLTADWKEIASGYVDILEPQDSVNEIRLTGRGMETPILKAQIKYARTYCSGGALPVETVIQQVLDDTLGVGAPQSNGSLGGLSITGSSGIVLYTPTYSPTFNINPGFIPGSGSLMDALTKLAQLGGMVVRYMYDSSNVNRFTLLKPNRNPTTPNWVIGPEEYLSIPMNKLDITGVRTYIDLYYIDPTTGQQHVSSPALLSGTVACTAGAATFSTSQSGVVQNGYALLVDGALFKVSAFNGTTGCTLASVNDGSAPTFATSNWTTSEALSRYGLIPMRVDVAGTVSLTGTAAQGMADAMRSDLELPPLEQQFTTYAFWFVQLYDYGQLIANNVHYNSDQYGGVTQYTHTLSQGTMKTMVGLKGKPAGRYRTWLQYALNPLTNGLDVPTKPALTDRINQATGSVDVLFDGADLANETRVVIRTDRAPTFDEIAAGVSGGVGIVTGACYGVATVPVSKKFWIGGVSLNRFGEYGDINVITSAFLGSGATPVPTVSFGTGVVQANQIAWPITLSPTATRVCVCVKMDDSDPDSSTIAGADVELLVGQQQRFWYDLNSSSIVSGVLNFAAPIYKGDHYITATAFGVDALNQRGPKVSVKLQGPGVSPPSAPNKPSVTAATPTSNSLPVTVTFPTSGTAATKIRPYLDGAAQADVAIGTWAYSGTQSVTPGGTSLLPGSSHTLRASIVTSGGVESSLSDPISMTCTADTSGGGGGTGLNGKLPAPVAGTPSYSRPAQQSILPFTLGSGTPSGMVVRIWSAPTIGGTYTLIGINAYASPAAADANQLSTAQILYYKLSTWDSTGAYTESDLSSAITVHVPAGSS